MKLENVYIVDALRTPIGSFGGVFQNVSAVQLATSLAKELISRTKLDPHLVNEIILGMVLSGNQGQAPARQVGIFSGLSKSVSALTINKVCSSGLYSGVLASMALELGASELILSGGMENMSQAPYYLENYRQGVKLGEQKLVDSIIKDGLWDVYNNFHMGCAGELCAKTYGYSREAQDEYAIMSYERSLESISKGLFKNEILAQSVSQGKNTTIIDKDEEPQKFNKEKVSQLKPAFQKDGTITAVNASSLNDGAAMLLFASRDAISKYGLKPRAKVLSTAVHSQEPEWFTTAPVKAVQNAIAHAELKKSEIDYYEINEAFSSVAMACGKDLEIDKSKLNIRGGAVSLGHPIGASGARILVTLLNILEAQGGKTGVVGICNGGGEATAMVIEVIS